MNAKTLILSALALLFIGCSHPVRAERNRLRIERWAHCIDGTDYSPLRCYELKHQIIVDDIALAYGAAR